MMYQNSAALNYDARQAQPQPQRQFEVVEGRGLDARVRRGVSPKFVSKLSYVFAAAVAFFIVGAISIALTTTTASMLRDSSTLRSQISQAQELESELKVEQSVLSSNHRIANIATKHYGMVLDSNPEKINIPVKTVNEAA